MVEGNINVCEYSTNLLEYDEFNLKAAPTNIDTQNTNECKVEKCVLVNKLSEQNEINIKREEKRIVLNLPNNTETSYLKFGGKKFTILEIEIVKDSSHYYDNKPYNSLELILKFQGYENNNSLLIMTIPFRKTGNSGSNLSSINFTKILSEMNSQFTDQTLTEFTSINNLNLSQAIPDTRYFTYNSIINNDQNIIMIVFTPENGIEIRESLIYAIQNYISCDTKEIYLKNEDNKLNVPIYYSKNPPLKTDIEGDDIYIDCKPVETQDPEKEYETVLTKVLNSVPDGKMDELISKIVEYILKFLFAILVICLINYLPSLFKTNDIQNGNNNVNSSTSNAIKK
ncbi:hypothetical protein CL656_07265 [bacterium]|nr:hypothetical protein [bacterium]